MTQQIGEVARAEAVESAGMGIRPARGAGSWLSSLFLVTLVLPPEAGFMLGDLYFSPHRLLLLAALIPCSVVLVRRRGGSLLMADLFMCLHVLWAAISFMFVHGLEQGLKSGGIYTVEVFGSYVLARVAIRDPASFRGAVRVLSVTVMLLALFTVPESLTGKHLLRDLFGSILGRSSFEGAGDERFGLTRAFGTFPHPILYGVFCASAFGLAWYALPARSVLGRLGRAIVILLAAMSSVSTGALLTAVVQCLLIAWDHATRGVAARWLILVSGIVCTYFLVDQVSNRSGITVIISYLTFNPETGYARQLIWEYGSAEVLRHPWFGIGFGDWQRPDWMHSPSVDNFWLLTAMRHGLPAASLLALAVGSTVRNQLKCGDVTPEAWSCRAGWLVCLIALCIAGTTVHLWGSSLTFFCFILGSADWIGRHSTAYSARVAESGSL